MRILLVVSVALIGLFADQSSLFATLVYRYDFVPQFVDNYSSTPTSGYIEMRYASGTGMHPLDAIYDFQVTGRSRDIADAFVPAISFSLSDYARLFNSFSGETPSMDWTTQSLGGYWQFISNSVTEFDFEMAPNFGPHTAYVVIGAWNINTYWPYDFALNNTQGPSPGSWQFTGTRDVPESGGTLVYMVIGILILGTAGIKGLARKGNQ